MSYRIIIAALAFLFLGNVAYAQALPGAADLGHIEKNVPAPTQPRATEPPEQHDIKSELRDDAHLPKFKLNKLTISGGAVYSEADLLPLYSEYIGQNTTEYTMQKIADDITQKYYADGYIIVLVNPVVKSQEKGVAEIQVLEGYVGRVRLEGEHADSFFINQTIENIKALKPFNAKQLERYMLDISALKGIRASATLEPIKDNAQPGEMGIVINFNDEELHHTLAFDNWGSRYVGPYEANLTGNFHSVLQPYGTLSLTAFGSIPPNELKYFRASLAEPLTSDGLMLQTNISNSDSVPGYTLKRLDIQSDAISIDIQINYPWIRTRSEELRTGIELEHKDIQSKTLGSELYHDKYTALRLPINYSNSDNYNGANNLSAVFSKGLNVLGARETGSFNLSRAFGESDFTKLELQLSRLQQITNDVQLFANLRGQYSWSPLLTAEEFGYGGQEFGRGYDSSELAGDHGLAESLELRYNGIPEAYSAKTQLFGFFDAGQLWNIDPGASNRLHGSSVGAGARISIENMGSNLDLTVAAPLSSPAAAPDHGNGKNPQFYFVLTKTL